MFALLYYQSIHLIYRSVGRSLHKHSALPLATSRLAGIGNTAVRHVHHDSQQTLAAPHRTARMSIPGTEVRCLWDGRGININPVPLPSITGEVTDLSRDPADQSPVYGVMTVL